MNKFEVGDLVEFIIDHDTNAYDGARGEIIAVWDDPEWVQVRVGLVDSWTKISRIKPISIVDRLADLA